MISALKPHRLFRQILETPEHALEYLDLVYVTDHHLNIKRLKHGENFIYQKGNKTLKQKKEIERINKLVIPPAWDAVRIASLGNGHLQAVGRDKKLRKQYRYHEKWNRIRNQTKFYKMAVFGDALPKIRHQVDKDLEQKEFTKTKVLALIVKLLEETHIRIGNQQYAKRNQTYGLSTLRSKHVDIHNNKMKFEFVGKRGKEHKVTVRNKKLIKLVNQCEEIPGWELFKYYDEFGEKHVIDSAMVNQYLQDISSEFFTAKDFRTWSASLICFNTLLDFGLNYDEKEKNKNIILAIDTAAKALGNTRTVARKYYVHPLILSSYKDDSIAKEFKMANSEKQPSSTNFTSSENAMLHLLKKFSFNFQMD